MKIFNTKENLTMLALDCKKSEKTFLEETGCNIYFNSFLICILFLIIISIAISIVNVNFF